MRLWIAAIVCLHLVLAGSDALAQEDVQKLIDDLSSSDRPTRHDAAKELGKPRNPNIFAVRPLLAAAKRETHLGALGEMLRTLGKSGMMEVLGFIQTHAQSPIPKLKTEGRRALKSWLVTNGIMAADDELPDPPHAYYQPPPVFPPNRPAGRPIDVWANEQPPVDAEGVPAKPGYESPQPDGITAGMRVGSKPKWGLVGAGIGVFGGLYLATNIGAGIDAANDNDDYDARLLIPIIGPLFPAAELFDDSGFLAELSHLAGVLLVIDTLGQMSGVIMAISGAVVTNPTLERTNSFGLRVSPTSLALTGSF